MIKLSGFEGGGGVFVLEALQSGEIVLGQPSGDLLNVPEVAGKVYKITVLSTNVQTNAAFEANMRLTIDGVNVHDDAPLTNITAIAGDTTTTGTAFGVGGKLVSTTVLNARARLYNNIYCTSFSLTKVSGATVNTIDYTYEVGSIK